MMFLAALIFIAGLFAGTIMGYALAALMFIASRESRNREDEDE